MKTLVVFSACLLCGSVGCSDRPNANTPAEAASVATAAPEQSKKTLAVNDKTAVPGNKAIQVSSAGILHPIYANEFRIHLSDGEVLLDFGVTRRVQSNRKGQFKLLRQIALSAFTFKRFASALGMAIERHEQAFGKLKTTKGEVRFESDQKVETHYANFVRVSSTPEELALECGLNSNPFGSGQAKITVSDIIVVFHSTAKRLQAEISAAIAEYEKEHGVIEIDVRKRVLPSLQQ